MWKRAFTIVCLWESMGRGKDTSAQQHYDILEFQVIGSLQNSILICWWNIMKCCPGSFWSLKKKNWSRFALSMWNVKKPGECLPKSIFHHARGPQLVLIGKGSAEGVQIGEVAWPDQDVTLVPLHRQLPPLTLLKYFSVTTICCRDSSFVCRLCVGGQR